jgi:hypothetical protein
MAGHAPESVLFPLHIQPLAGYDPENDVKIVFFILFGRVSAGMTAPKGIRRASCKKQENQESGWGCSGLSTLGIFNRLDII